MSASRIIYYVAVSLDGYIAGVNDDIAAFHGDAAVQKYLSDLQDFKTVIMGRRTYEIAYRFGMTPGEPAYPHMDHYIFSNTLQFDKPSRQVQIVHRDIDQVHKIKEDAEGDIYLCGGGVFAGWLLQNHLIDVLKIKLNPIVLGSGIPIFSNAPFVRWRLVDQCSYDDGIQIIEYQPEYQ